MNIINVNPYLVFVYISCSLLISCEYNNRPASHSINYTLDTSLTTPNFDDEFWKFRLDDHGNPVSTPTDLLKLIGGELELCHVDWDDSLQWENIGPHNSFNHRRMNQGRVESISINKHDADDMLAGGLNGGVWRSQDGGATWTNTSDDEGFSIVGFHDITRHPKDPNLVYAATRNSLDKWNNGQRGYGLGIVHSKDGGNTWEITGQNPAYGQWQSGTLDIAVDPRSTLDSTILYCINQASIFRWTGRPAADQAWTTIYTDNRRFSGPAIYGGVFNHDIEIDRYGNLYLCNALGVYKMQVNQTDLIQFNNISVPSSRSDTSFCPNDTFINPLKVLYDMEINLSGDISLLANYYYAKLFPGKCKIRNKPYYYYVSKNGGRSWSAPQRLNSSGYAKPLLAVNQYNSDIFYYEGSSRQVMKSINGGRASRRLRSGRNHVDVRCLTLYSSRYRDSLGLQDRVYVGNDGGVGLLDDGKLWKDLTGDGMANTNYFGLGISDQDREYIFGGAQDGSINFYRNGEWYTTAPGGDNGDCLIDPRDKFHVYQTANGVLQKGRVDSIRWRGRTVKKVLNGVQLFPVLLNPSDPNEIFAGGNALIVSSDEGRTWNSIDGDYPKLRINKLAMSAANSNVIYFVLNGFFWNDKKPANTFANQGGIYRGERDDKGQWTVSNVTSNLASKCKGDDNCGLAQSLTSVVADPKNENRLWVTMGGFKAGKKVFYSTDGGHSYNNISECLPNLPALCIAYHEDSDDGLYLGTDYGVFHRNSNLTEWIYFANGGPKTTISDMEINNGSDELIVSTLGRGIWRVNLK